jgi:predicted Zn-dependent protease
MSGLLYNLGRRLGRATIPAIRKTRCIYDGLAGNENEALRAETKLGSALAAELRAVTQPSNDLVLTRLVEDLCQRLAPADDPRRMFHCEVIHDDTPNALALPGGFIFLNDSLVDFCERQPDELAFVIAHEMAHIIRRHAWDRMLNDAMLRVASTVSGRAGMLGAWLRKSGLGLLRSAHSRERELEADALGCELMITAGFAPVDASELLQRLAGLDGPAARASEYFSSHPPAAERIAHLEKLRRHKPAPQHGEREATPPKSGSESRQ